MKKTFLSAGIAVAAGLMALTPNAHAASQQACELCKIFTYHLADECIKTGGCELEEMYSLLEAKIDTLPASMRVTATQFLGTYGDMIIDLYQSGQDPLEICITINVCGDVECTGCTNCTSDADWSLGESGYLYKVSRKCNCNTCVESTLYQCAAGYYGSSTDGKSGCTQCPSSGGIVGMSNAGSTEITSCYIPANLTATDSTGTYTYTSDCFYTN